jgi:hypothetical protein
MAARILNRAAAEETYRDIEHRLVPWIKAECGRGVEPHDAVSAAHDAFLYAYEKWDPSRASLVTLMGHKFRCRILDYRASRRDERANLVGDGDILALVPDREPSPDWEGVYETLTADAQVLANIALEQAIDYPEQPSYLRELRHAICDALIQIGWTKIRVKQAVRDLLEAMAHGS